MLTVNINVKFYRRWLAWLKLLGFLGRLHLIKLETAIKVLNKHSDKVFAIKVCNGPWKDYGGEISMEETNAQ